MKCLAVVAATLFSLAAVGGQTPAPIWPADGKIPAALKDQYVFLTPDLGTVVILFPPDADGKRQMERLIIHNRIDATVEVTMKADGTLYRYDYLFVNNKTSQDGASFFFMVVSPDPGIQTDGGQWGGGFMKNTVANRVGLSGAPPGNWILWSAPLFDGPLAPPVPLPPGGSNRFRIESINRPGFTTASTEILPPFQISSDWPEAVILQANPLQDLDWVTKHVITLGPRYAPGDPGARIAMDYLTGIDDLVRAGRLEARSRYVRQTSEELRALSKGQTEVVPHGVPLTQLEREIQQGLALCFGASK